MGFFSQYVYKSKKDGKEWWLHFREQGKGRLYYFSKDRTNAVFSLPAGYDVVENLVTGMPFLKNKTPKEKKPKEGTPAEQPTGKNGLITQK